MPSLSAVDCRGSANLTRMYCKHTGAGWIQRLIITQSYYKAWLLPRVITKPDYYPELLQRLIITQS